eukprot:INCI16246.3.p1 GENE.INCI16246.3~~INCI16246.3.p1  ORF type:complete len:114 (+),score=18.57 INCI16246.3:299-640(+)
MNWRVTDIALNTTSEEGRKMSCDLRFVVGWGEATRGFLDDQDMTLFSSSSMQYAKYYFKHACAACPAAALVAAYSSQVSSLKAMVGGVVLTNLRKMSSRHTCAVPNMLSQMQE